MDPDDILILTPEDLNTLSFLATMGIIPRRTDSTNSLPGEPWVGLVSNNLLSLEDWEAPERPNTIPFAWHYSGVNACEPPSLFRRLTPSGWVQPASVPSSRGLYYVLETLHTLMSLFESGAALRDGSQPDGPALVEEESRLGLVLRDGEDLLSAFENDTPFIHPRTYPLDPNFHPPHKRDSWVPSPPFLPFYKRIHAAMGGGFISYYGMGDLFMWGSPGIPWKIFDLTCRSPLYEESTDLKDPSWVTLYPLLFDDHLDFTDLIPHLREIAHRPRARVTLAEAMVLSILTVQYGWTKLYLEIFGGEWRLSKVCTMVLTLEEKGWGNLHAPA